VTEIRVLTVQGTRMAILVPDSWPVSASERDMSDPMLRLSQFFDRDSCEQLNSANVATGGR
jgi:hypothetical protein